MKVKREYLIISKKTAINYLVKTNDLRNWMINNLDLSDDYIVIDSKYFSSIRAALN